MLMMVMMMSSDWWSGWAASLRCMRWSIKMVVHSTSVSTITTRNAMLMTATDTIRYTISSTTTGSSSSSIHRRSLIW
uniref:Putative secreted protein n=1 Tax=Anopheles darlingi TaxID=43151 RepID=A0A2M4D4A8_ANODA